MARVVLAIMVCAPDESFIWNVNDNKSYWQDNKQFSSSSELTGGKVRKVRKLMLSNPHGL
jgi:hypothetical protein